MLLGIAGHKNIALLLHIQYTVLSLQVCCVSTTADGVSLVSVGHSDGLITVWDLSKHLMLWKACSLQVDVNSITYALNTLLENGSSPGTDGVCKKQDCREEEKLEEVTENQKDIDEKEQQHNKQVEDKELQHRTQQEETRLDNQRQQETGGRQQPLQKEIETQLNKDEELEVKEQQQERENQEDKQLEKHEDDHDQENEQDETQQEDTKQLVEDKQQQKDTENQQEPQQREDQQVQDELASSHPNEDREPQQDEDVAQTVNATGKSCTTQTSNSSPVSSCQLDSLSIVHSLTPIEKDSNKNTGKSATNKDTTSNIVQESSLLTGVSFSRENGKKDAAIIVYGIPSKYEGESAATGAAGKSKHKYYQPSSTTAVEGMNDLFLGLDEMPIMPPPPINVDLDTPSWQLAPPTIPAAPPPPPVKGGTPVKKPCGARHLQTFLISENINNLPNDASPVVSAFQPCGHNQVIAAVEYGPDHGGCVILFNLNNFYNQTIIGDSIIYEFKTPLEHVTSMCAIEKPNTDGTGSSHYIATIDKGGSLIIYGDETGKLKQMVILTPSDSYISCFSCTNVGLLGVVTKSGKVVTIRVVTGQVIADESDGDAMYGGDSSPSLNPHQGLHFCFRE